MKGLLLKDLFMSKAYCRVYLLISSVFMVLYAYSTVSAIPGASGNLFFLLYPTVLASMVPVNLLAYESQCKWETYAGTLPYTRAQIVSGKYLVGLVFFGVLLVLSLTVQAIAMVIAGVFSLGILVNQGLLMLLCFFASCTFVLPLIFRFGVEKGRIFYMLIIGLLCGLTAAIGFITKGSLSASDWVFPKALALTLAASMALYLGSWLLSIRLYEKREF